MCCKRLLENLLVGASNGKQHERAHDNELRAAHKQWFTASLAILEKKVSVGRNSLPSFSHDSKAFWMCRWNKLSRKNSFDWAQVNWFWSDSKDIPSLGLDGEFERVIEANKERYLEGWFRDLLVLSFNSRTINFERFEIKNNYSTRACWI